ncbi:G-protein coupled receptors family 1 profile domain-containing protein [Caenorhabditis elegans]|uniref:G-protein coupled receptors family 1 profile domain-containing protein n=1 Tax=Caenorhabditis elegans TaxID=6239 RepID=H2KYC0_CAEEL|nr:G-protein coupled receptors family 1 profile domain-containing protein [Caenorhabditis elegans]CCD62224.1 G-protein coupled receptors family 1 profile domain-containing protein [Caenorhabditis elegans]|eukprot:NP_001255273.1 Serpentine Receptor, class SX [Caenorhabditis elegans]
MTSEDNYKMHRIIIYSIVFIFEILGLFGNINLIAVILRNKVLRSNFGLIMLCLAFFHTVCLFFELINMGFGILATFYSYRIFRSICFHTTFPVILAHCLQTGTICILSLDLFLAIVIPFKYRHFRMSFYLPMLLFLPLAYAVGIVVAAKILLDDAEISMCNPPSSMVPSVRQRWYEIMLIFSFLTVILYSGAFGLLSVKMRRNSSDIRLIEKKALRTLKVLIVIFLFTRFFSTGLATLVTSLGIDPEYSALVHNYNVIPAMAAYSQNTYVCFFRSEEYRRLLTEQFSIYFPCMKIVLPVKITERSTSIKRGPTIVVKI